MVQHKEGAGKMDDEEIHIAVGKNFKKEKANILWTAANFPRATIVLVHVHLPSILVPFMGGAVLHKFADEKEKEMHRHERTEAMINMLQQYKNQCGKRKISAHYLVCEDIIAGIVKMIQRLKIKNIVIGSRNMSEQLLLCTCCQIWLLDNGRHIFTRDGTATECSNSHLEHTGSTADGGSPEFELDDQSDGYTTALSDFETGALAEENLKESAVCQEEVEILPEEDTDQFGDIQIRRNVTKEAEELRAKIDILRRKLKEMQGEGHNHRGRSLSAKQNDVKILEHIVQLSMWQIRKATNNLNSKIGEGGYGAVYEGKLYGIPVAIKLPRADGIQGYTEYQQEVAVLSRIKHPHIVWLIGVCPESRGLIYEHLPNGTLMDRLVSKGLSWEDRIRILAEQRSALAYLHCRRPHAIIHADLKLSNILLDAGNVSRLGDFGTARTVHVKPLEEETICRRTNPMGTPGYMDPVFLTTGELTTGSDVYSFGVVVLKVLTGQVGVQLMEVEERVREAVRANAVQRVLDASAGRWPWAKKHAKGLLQLALRCCSLERERRPAIMDGAWKTLDNLQPPWPSMASRIDVDIDECIQQHIG